MGIVAGLQPNGYFGCHNNFSIYANFDAALLYGKYKSTKKESYSQVITNEGGESYNSIDFSDEFANKFWNLVPIIDLGLGLSWEEYWCGDRYRSEIAIGWEHHIWFNANQRLKSNDGHDLAFEPHGSMGFIHPNFTFASYDKVDTDLTFGGLVVRAKFEF